MKSTSKHKYLLYVCFGKKTHDICAFIFLFGFLWLFNASFVDFVFFICSTYGANCNPRDSGQDFFYLFRRSVSATIVAYFDVRFSNVEVFDNVSFRNSTQKNLFHVRLRFNASRLILEYKNSAPLL